jgi:hypothetical protein
MTQDKNYKRPERWQSAAMVLITFIRTYSMLQLTAWIRTVPDAIRVDEPVSSPSTARTGSM